MNKNHSLRKLFFAGTLLLQLSYSSFHSHAAPGDIDLSFDPGSGVNGTVNAVVIQPDGKVIIGGEFTTVHGLARTNIARLNADGSGDSSFTSLPMDYPVYSLALQSDGRVLVGSEFHNFGLTRLNSDGSPDTNFNTNAYEAIASAEAYYPERIVTILVQPDGKILYAGESLLRLNGDGTLDLNFTAVIGFVSSMALRPDGKLIAGGYFFKQNGTFNYDLLRINADGSPDNSFDTAAEGVFKSIVLQPDGKMLIGGGFIWIDGTNHLMARLNANGTLDATFAAAAGNGVWGNPGFVNAISLQSDGKVVIGGQFNSINGQSRTNLARLNADGSLDANFPNGTGGVSGEPQFYPGTSVQAIALQTNGSMLMGGAFTTVNGTNRNRLARLNSDGSLDPSFDPGNGLSSSISSLVVQPDGKVLIAGIAIQPRRVNGFLTRNGIERLNVNGGRDSSFNPGMGANADVVSVALQADGKVLIGGSFTAVNGTNRLAFARLNADGNLDGSFDPDIIALVPYEPMGTEHSTAVTTVLLQPDGKILVAGYHQNLITGEEVFLPIIRCFVVRFLANGNPDPAFTPFAGQWADGLAYWFHGWVSYPVSALAVQSDGKIIFSGERNSVNDTNLTGIARFNASGTPDNSFTPALGRYAWVSSLELQPDNKLLMAGSFGIVSGTNRSGICRLQVNGSLDNTFNPIIGPNASVSSFALQPDGKVVLGGSFTNINGTNLTEIARLNSDGSLDSSFNPGAASGIRSLALQPDGKVLMGGGFLSVNGVMRPYAARLHGDSLAPLPLLNIAQSNAFLIVSWPAAALGFQLQESTNLGLANPWSTVAQPTLTNGGQISVTIPSSAASKFFQLKSQ